VSERTAYIIGSGGHAHVIRSLLPHSRVRFLVDRDPAPDDIFQEDFFADLPPGDADYFIGIGDNAARRRYFDRLKRAGLRVSSCIAPNAWIASDAAIGEGVFIGAGAMICSRSRLADNIIVNTLAAVDHDCTIGSDTQLAPGVILGGRIRIGRGAFLGLRCSVLPGLEIGDGAIIMAGALVTRNVAGGTRVGGLPARIVNEAGPAPTSH
jgi:sugar O-acyltransferase (sialic acid O-acetyltransferase NeuD family)